MSETKHEQNNQMKQVRFSAQILVVGMILSITFFLMLIDSFKTYRSDVFILVTSKSAIATKQHSQIVNSILELPKTLAFYDRLLKFNPDVRDVASGLTPDQRKEKWNRMLSTEQASFDASVIRISVTASREADADQLAVKTTRSIFDTVAFYYNIKNDIDLRIVDGPIAKSQFVGWYWFLILSIFLGYAVATLLNYIVFGGDKRTSSGSDPIKMSTFFDFRKSSKMLAKQGLESLNRLYRNEQEDQSFTITQKAEDDKKFQEIKKITKMLEPGKYPNFPEMPTIKQREAVVPDNLPIADSSYFLQEQIAEPPVQEQEVIIEEKPEFEEVKEPTPEELKKRLNELLRGKL